MVEFQQVCMAYKEKEVLNNVDLTIQDGEFFVLIGSSGCGKTTLLKSINKLLPVQQGTLKINGTPVSQIKVNQLPNLVGYVVQAGGLFPHLTVEENIALVMKVAQYPKEQIHDRVTAMLKMVNLDPALYRNQYPSQLSGGQQQRVALARALVIEPSVLLFDEPLSNLDAKLRVTMRTEIRKIQQKVGITAIYVTHDQSEAMSISDKIIIMSQGRVEQIGTPREIYYHPSSRFVADFIGEANFLDAKVKSVNGEKAVIDVVGQELEVNNFAHAAPGEDATLVIRPEGATLAEQGLLEATVSLSTFMGSYQYYEVMVGNMMIQITDYNPVNRRIYEVGEKAYLDFDPKGVYILSAG